jgi:NADPH2:quinone reductase
MKAALSHHNGPSSVLSVEDIPTPNPGPGEVRVKIVCSGVNPTDWKIRSGITMGEPDGFQIPHQDGSGIIDAVGEEVADRGIGQRVWLYMAAAGNRYGTAAEYSLLPAKRTVLVPDNASYELGASLGVPAVTAAHCLGGDPKAISGANILVAGGAGAVGHYAIELAKHAGARVATTVSSTYKAQLAEAAGADLVVNYKTDNVTEKLKSFAPQMDRIIEVAFGANLEINLALSGPGTEIVVYADEIKEPVLPTRRLMMANLTIRYVLLYRIRPHELDAAVNWTSEALRQGALSTLPIHSFPLQEVAKAQDFLQQGAVGKVIVLPQ